MSRSTAAPAVPTIAEIDTLPSSDAAAALAPLFEGAQRFLDRLVVARPFGTAEALFARAEAIALAMPEGEQVELLDAHPRLGAPPGSVSPDSFREQGYGRGAAGDLGAELDALNAAYELRFGFRYCVFVAGRTRAALLPAFRAALAATREDELRRALRDVVAIAADRYRRRIEEGRP